LLRLRILLQSNYLFLLILIFSFSFAFFRIYIIGYESKYTGYESYIEGRIVSYTKREDRLILIIRGKEKVRITYFNAEDLNLELGMWVRVEGELTKPLGNTIPNSFNFKRFLNNRQIYFLMTARDIIVLRNNQNFIYLIKNALINRIESFEHTRDYLKAFLIGDRTEMDIDATAAYRANGVSHLFAISGMHLNLIAGFLLFSFKNNKTKSLPVILILIFYVSLTNYAASIYRAIVFTVLIYLNKTFSLNITTKNILFLTCSLLIIYNPLIIYDIGFQYSVVVTYGLIIAKRYYKKNYFYNLFMISFIAFLFSMPITIFYFYEINFLSIINNLIFGPLISLIIYPLSLITLFIRFLEPLLYMFIGIMEFLNRWLNEIDLLRVIIPKVPLIFYLLYFVLLNIFIYSNNKKYLIMAIILIFSFKLRYYLDSNIYIYFLDVGQGDATLIFNNREVILIDTGGNRNFQVSNNVISLMKSRGISTIDLLLLTHGHEDHAGGAPNIINNMRVRNVMINNNEINELEQKIINMAPNVVTKYQSIFNFQIFNDIIGPDENSSSIFALLKIDDSNLLFTGDAGRGEELHFLRENYPIRIDILHLGHHGSRTSSDFNFLKQTKVKTAIISSGRNNRFNHPHRDVMDNLYALDIKYFNTAKNGTIRYTFRHNNYTITIFPP